MRELIIKKRFCGPPASGNGGYSCGLIAKHLQGLNEVRLMAPPPLDTPMQLKQDNDQAELLLGDKKIAQARPCQWEINIPEPPNFDDAKKAQENYQGFIHHSLPTCFVCGPKREKDGLKIFAGRVSKDNPLFASTWIVDDSLANSDGVVNSEFIWAALDCPGYFAVQAQADFALLGSFSVKTNRGVLVGEQLVVTGWPVSSDGRKHIAGTALFDSQQNLVAHALATWVSVPKEAFVKSTQ